MSQSNEPSFDSQFDANMPKRVKPRSLSKKTLQRRQMAMGRAIEALESRRLLSVSGFAPAVTYNAGTAPAWPALISTAMAKWTWSLPTRRGITSAFS